MMVLLPLLGCGWVPQDALHSRNDLTQARALEDLPAWQARWIVPLLSQIVNETDNSRVRQGAYEALVRADTPEAFAVLRAHLVRTPETRSRTLRALGWYHTKRSCDLMAELWLAPPPGDEQEPWLALFHEDEQERLEANLSSTSLDEGWPCFQSLQPYRESDPRADALWRRVAPTL
jgi:hypothetical protein